MEFEDWAASRIPVLVRTAVALSRDLALAEDLVQEVLIKTSRRWDQIGPLEARDRYVHRMLVNEFMSWRRKWARLIPVADVVRPDVHPDHSDAGADRHLLDAQLARLPRRQQVVLALRYYTGLPDTQIADALGCAESTVRSLASRGLSALRVDPTLLDEFCVAHRRFAPEEGK